MDKKEILKTKRYSDFFSVDVFVNLITIESKYKYLESVFEKSDIDINIMTKDVINRKDYKTKHLYQFAKSKYLVDVFNNNIR